MNVRFGVKYQTLSRKEIGMSKKSKSLDPSIVVAIIGVVGTIIAALITVLPNRNQVSVTQPPAAVATEDSAPTSPASVGDTPENSAPVSTDVPISTSVPLLAVGEDWAQNCISAIWQAYPAASDANITDGCYVNLFNSVFSAQSGRLSVSVDKRVDSREISGIFAELPSNSIVNLNVHLDDLQTGEVWIGIFDQPDIESNGFAITIQGSAKESTFFALGMPTAENLYKSAKVLKDSGSYSISLDVTPNTVFGLIEQYLKTSTFSLPSEKKWLFLGYRALTTGRNRVEGNFFDLTVTSR
jgi:hypothetical protein